ncbi:hypothetical protein PLICRDRAFT_31362 [Plicaturopsis crispa FD-325 SS-3]|nr:hypothetical protein PLICRDRAFT_31362 [Plicaturopsis crispa FD-325 SS-3]
MERRPSGPKNKPFVPGAIRRGDASSSVTGRNTFLGNAPLAGDDERELDRSTPFVGDDGREVAETAGEEGREVTGEPDTAGEEGREVTGEDVAEGAGDDLVDRYVARGRRKVILYDKLKDSYE